LHMCCISLSFSFYLSSFAHVLHISCSLSLSRFLSFSLIFAHVLYLYLFFIHSFFFLFHFCTFSTYFSFSSCTALEHLHRLVFFIRMSC
jgi:hypothetical protein